MSAYQNSTEFFLKFFFKLIQIIKNDKIFENYVYCKRNFWFISKLIRTFYNNIKKYDFMIKIRDKKNQKSSGRADSLIKQKRNYGWLRSDMIVC